MEVWILVCLLLANDPKSSDLLSKSGMAIYATYGTEGECREAGVRTVNATSVPIKPICIRSDKN